VTIPCSVLIARIVGRCAGVPSTVSRFVTMEVVKRRFSARRHRSLIAAAWIVAVIDVTVETLGAVEPRTRANENSAHKPVRAVVTVGGTIIRSVVKVTVRTDRRHPDANGNLSRRF
jgi:hypothetical protein